MPTGYTFKNKVSLHIKNIKVHITILTFRCHNLVEEIKAVSPDITTLIMIVSLLKCISRNKKSGARKICKNMLQLFFLCTKLGTFPIHINTYK